MHSIKVLSLFDGIGVGLYALKQAGIPVEVYYASEIDKDAIAVARYNHPEIIHLGDVQNIDPKNLPKIDLLIGGSPCVDLSFIGKQKGLEACSLKEYLSLKNTASIGFLNESITT